MSKSEISNTLTKTKESAVLMVEHNTPSRETQGKLLFRIYTSQRVMANKTNIYINIYVSDKNIIHR